MSGIWWCMDYTPAQLFAKLEEWGMSTVDKIIIWAHYWEME